MYGLSGGYQWSKSLTPHNPLISTRTLALLLSGAIFLPLGIVRGIRVKVGFMPFSQNWSKELGASHLGCKKQAPPFNTGGSPRRPAEKWQELNAYLQATDPCMTKLK